MNMASTTMTLKMTLQITKIMSCQGRRMERTASGITSHVILLLVATTPKGNKYFPFRISRVASTMVLRMTH